VNHKAWRLPYRAPFSLGAPVFDRATTTLLRAVLEEVCESISRRETGARAHVASKLLEAAARGETSLDGLRQAGCNALSDAPSMRR